MNNQTENNKLVEKLEKLPVKKIVPNKVKEDRDNNDVREGGMSREEMIKKRIPITNADVRRFQEQKIERDSQIVEGVFRVIDGRAGSTVCFCFSMNGEEPIKYTLFDGKKHRLPYGVVNHLINNCYTKIYKSLSKNAEGEEIYNIFGLTSASRSEHHSTQKRHKFSFQSTEFSENDGEYIDYGIADVHVVR